MTGSYSTEDVARATGLSWRQVDWYLSRRYVDHPDPNPGPGQPRTFDDAQLDAIGTVAALVSAGLKPSTAAQVAQCEEYEHGPIQIRFDQRAIHDQLRANLQNNADPNRKASA